MSGAAVIMAGKYLLTVRITAEKNSVKFFYRR